MRVSGGPVQPSSWSARRDSSPSILPWKAIYADKCSFHSPYSLFLKIEISPKPRIIRENILSTINSMNVYAHLLPTTQENNTNKKLAEKHYAGYCLYWFGVSGYGWHLLKSCNVRWFSVILQTVVYVSGWEQGSGSLTTWDQSCLCLSDGTRWNLLILWA